MYTRHILLNFILSKEYFGFLLFENGFSRQYMYRKFFIYSYFPFALPIFCSTAFSPFIKLKNSKYIKMYVFFI